MLSGGDAWTIVRSGGRLVLICDLAVNANNALQKQTTNLTSIVEDLRVEVQRIDRAILILRELQKESDGMLDDIIGVNGRSYDRKSSGELKSTNRF